MDNRKVLMFGFIACILAALAYTFVFADLPFATPETPEAAAPATETTPAATPETPPASTP
jgi:FlaG/FlaF family flagellin (archaellin)